jgi:hypothetical protein
MLGVNKRRHAAVLLRLGDDLERDRGLARRFRAKDFHYATAREAAYAQRSVKRDRAGGDNGDGNNGFLAPQPHDRAFAKLLFDLPQRQLDCPPALAPLIPCHDPGSP